jgi:glutamine synthetase
MGAFVNDLDGFFGFCDENDVLFVDFLFTDLSGVLRHLTYDMGAVDAEKLAEGIPFDASSFPGWQPNFHSDLLLKADVGTAFLDPFAQHATVNVICDIWDIYKDQPYEKCPRSIGKAAMAHFQDESHGDIAYFGTEKEFFIFESVLIEDDYYHSMYQVDSVEGEWNDKTEYPKGNAGHRPGTKGGYMQVPPVDSLNEIRAEMLTTLKQVGLDVFHHHHEVGQAQVEIGVKHDTLVGAGDIVQIYKYVVKSVAERHGKSATFMPKPLFDDNGSGMHIHQSLWKDGKNLFYEEGSYGQISDTARYYMGGIFAHAATVAAFTNASANSYKRLTPGYEAPTILTYAAQNRSASIRIPYAAHEEQVRLEARFPDPSGNSYLTLTALLLAGLDGINNQIEPIGPHDEDLFELSPDEIEDRELPELPDSLKESLHALKHNNEFLRAVMSEEFISTYRKLKLESQVLPDQARPTPFEFLTTYSC